MSAKSDITISKLYELLSEHSVEYLVVGGLAVQTYGYSRISMGADGLPLGKQDIDIWYNPTIANYYKVVNVLSDLGLDVEELKSGAANPKESFLRHEFKNFKLDFLPTMLALPDFKKSYNEKRIAKYRSALISIISYSDLIKNKEATARAKDIEDVIQLKLKNESSE